MSLQPNKHHYSLFEILFLIGFYLIVVGMSVVILLESRELSERLFRLGVWVIVGFFLLTLVHGAVKGVHRTKVRIPVGWMLVSFAVSAGLFLAGFWAGSA